MEFIFGMLNNSSLLLFGVFVSASILGISMHKQNIKILLGFCLIINVIQVLIYANIGLQKTQWLYPIHTHIPTLILFLGYYKRNVLSSLFAILSAYLCCQLSKWLSMLILTITNNQIAEYAIHTAITIIVGILIIRYLTSSMSIILTKPKKIIFIFSILPIAYYIFDYISTVYTNLLYSGSEIIFEFLPFVLSIAYLVFCIVYFSEYEEKCEIERHNQLMRMKRIHSEKEIEAIKRSEYAVSILRHDLRHFLANIYSYIEQDDIENAKSYITEVIESVTNTATQRYCENEIVNMIISSYEQEMIDNDIKFHYLIQIPSNLQVSDVDFTSILSNGLDNAIHAVSILDLCKREITLDLRMHDKKILLSIKNPYVHKVDMIDGIPRAKEEGHGLGTQSIKYVAEKLHGNCQFIAKDGQFTLRVVL